ncbi:3-hydroxyisobutyrate dehydrogenase [Breoghania corrubedonensis]|uniref:3-hydroxyisobutyrate dehydrogenase n=1 Tax=Breoghania corrubedonensis TaxID=665038 RepID=A0A2T5VDZ2_9HYPH|nr:NAD(P)-dependent oxidoreductase [Breoghania corrubedonensis]PTW61979.1 3-hydroxyisobutyrate dehydrogenase [Breoghania corrubedonensis]
MAEAPDLENTAGGRVGFIGIGNMGWPMAANLVRCGFQVSVYDTDPRRSARFVDEIGGQAAASLAEMGHSCNTVVTMLPTGGIVRHVMLEAEEGGLAAHLAPGALLIDMSSSDPLGTRDLGETLKARGLAMVDAPVSGGVPRACEGTLTIMIGAGEASLAARARPVLEAMGRDVMETGPLGSGHAMKALNNYVAAAGFAAAAEALIAGRAFGLDPAVMIDIMNVSTGRNFSTENTIRSQVLTQDFASGFALALLAKDVGIACDLAKGIGLDLPLVEATSRMWFEARDALGGTKDHTEAIRAWETAARKEP